MVSDGPTPAGLCIDLEVSDPCELRLLYEHLRRLLEIRVAQVPGSPGAGEQGAADTLQILSVSVGPALAIAIRTLPEFVRSRRSDLKVTLRRSDRELSLEFTNKAQETDVQAVVDRFLDDA